MQSCCDEEDTFSFNLLERQCWCLHTWFPDISVSEPAYTIEIGLLLNKLISKIGIPPYSTWCKDSLDNGTELCPLNRERQDFWFLIAVKELRPHKKVGMETVNYSYKGNICYKGDKYTEVLKALLGLANFLQIFF